MTTEADVLAALKRLGTTPDDIAETLQAMGIQGRVALPYGCPLAVFLTRELGEPFAVGHIRASNTEYRVEVDLPTACTTFATRFDEGAWPALVATP